jgi:hypothetical protein
VSVSRQRRVTAFNSTPSLITSIDAPPEVESALAAINTAYNQVSSDISLAQGVSRPEDRTVEACR